MSRKWWHSTPKAGVTGLAPAATMPATGLGYLVDFSYAAPAANRVNG